jgi:3-(3-hydroxy-phenyl)propionate hydroxylase
MAQANAYPPSAWAKQGSRSVQNVAFEGTHLMRCLSGDTRFLGLAVGADAAALASLDALAALFPIDFRGVDPASPLAAHLGVDRGTVVVVRPDAYVAATLADATPEAVAAAMRDALAIDERERLAAAA